METCLVLIAFGANLAPEAAEELGDGELFAWCGLLVLEQGGELVDGLVTSAGASTIPAEHMHSTMAGPARFFCGG